MLTHPPQVVTPAAVTLGLVIAAAALSGAVLFAGASSAAQRPAFVVRPTGVPLGDLLPADAAAWDASTAVRWGAHPYDTEFRALYSADGLAIRFAARDDSPWHTMTERDDPLWDEEVVEIFIDPDGDGRNYAEIEINPANVVCDLQIFAARPTLRSDIAWDFDGLATDVSLWSDAAGSTVGWVATAVLPWRGFGTLDETKVALPPARGDRWRFNIFRIKRPGGPEAPMREVILAPWSATPGPSFHAPEAFADLIFGNEDN